MDGVEEVKSRLNIEDVIGEYVELKRAGRNYKGLSPFSNERTPSFMVSPEKQIWHDFSSGKGGNMFGFIMEMEGLDFKAALQYLARKAGVELAQYSGGNNYQAKLKERLEQASDKAANFYQRQLTANRQALTYLRTERGFSKETILQWRLGYSPADGRVLSDYLTKQGFTAEEMKRSGLVTERRHGVGDMFRGRIMVPLSDPFGKPIGFTARILNDEPGPKYINTPSTPIYDKSRHIFGLFLAKEAIRTSGYVVVAEGNMDVISSHQAGVKNVVATAGTAMTEMQIKALSRFTGDIRICFDADAAGLAATERVIPIAQKVGVNLSVVVLPSGKDPDELVRKQPAAWQKAIEGSVYALDWLLNHYARQSDLNSVQGKKAFTDAMLTVIRQLRDPVEREHYVRRAAELAGTSVSAVQDKLRRQGENQPTARRKVRQPAPLTDKDAADRRKLQNHFLAMVLMQPALRNLLHTCKTDFFDEGDPRTLFQFLRLNPEFSGDPQAAKGLHSIADYVKIISLQFEELYQGLSIEQLQTQANRLRARLIDSYVKNQKHRLAAAMQQTTDESEMADLIKQVNALNQLIKQP